jgi:hypothetical protein
VTKGIRVFAVLILLAGGLASVGTRHPNVAARLGWQATPASRQEPPNEEVLIVTQRFKAKRRVIEALLEGNLGLFEAAAWFHDLNSSPPAHPAEGWQRLPGRCDGEKLCRQVIGWARVHLQDVMPASQVMARLQEMEDELNAHIARHGKVVLPL